MAVGTPTSRAAAPVAHAALAFHLSHRAHRRGVLAYLCAFLKSTTRNRVSWPDQEGLRLKAQLCSPWSCHCSRSGFPRSPVTNPTGGQTSAIAVLDWHDCCQSLSDNAPWPRHCSDVMGRSDQRDYAPATTRCSAGSVWSSRQAGPRPAGAAASVAENGDGPLIFRIDETLERRRGGLVSGHRPHRTGTAVRSQPAIW